MVSFASSAGDMVGLGSMFAVKVSLLIGARVTSSCITTPDKCYADISYVLHAVTRNRRELTLSWRSAFPATEEEGAGLSWQLVLEGTTRSRLRGIQAGSKQTQEDYTCLQYGIRYPPIHTGELALQVLHVAVLISLRPAHLELLHRLPLLAAFALRHKVRFLKRASAPWRLNVTRRKVAASRVLLTMTWRWSGWRLVILALIRISLLKTLTLVLLHSCRRMALLVLPGIFHGMTLLLLMVGIVILLSLRIRWDVAASRRSIVVVV
ncbi:hypothetical protein KC344_g210 [Hortaea werneckii]|nr:hypothetical protein KC344_g210 [Hortaea werneckii]